MTITSEITRINNNIAAAYTAANDKGAALPENQNSANLANCISSISSGIMPVDTLTITENGTYDVANYANADVNVSSNSSKVLLLAISVKESTKQTDISVAVLPDLLPGDVSSYYDARVLVPKTSGKNSKSCAAVWEIDKDTDYSLFYRSGNFDYTKIQTVNINTDTTLIGNWVGSVDDDVPM